MSESEEQAIDQTERKREGNAQPRDAVSSKENQKSSDADSKGESDEKSDKDKSGDKPDSSDQEKKSDDGKPKKPPIYKKSAFIITVIVVLIVLIVGGIIFWLHARQYVSTDDAYVDGHIVQISPQIGARVEVLHVTDNQFVHRGDLLVELDTTDFQVALTQAKAQISSALGRLEQARAQVISAKASVPEALAQQHAAEAALTNAVNDLQRFQQVDERARSKQQLDSAVSRKADADAQLEKAQAQVESAQAGVATADAAVKAAQGEVATAEASAQRAVVNLSYCKIVAPTDGRITLRTVEAGNYVTLGQALFMIVDPNVWITANFKETQLTHMQPGQPVTIKVDAFPGVKWQGHIESIQAGSGSRFSILPAENATGNYVKIVQRVPVKIIFEHDANTNNAPMLSPGLSVIPKVKVR